MTTVYVLHAFGDVAGVYSTPERAEEARVDACKAANYHGAVFVCVEEYELDAGPDGEQARQAWDTLNR